MTWIVFGVVVVAPIMQLTAQVNERIVPILTPMSWAAVAFSAMARMAMPDIVYLKKT